MSPEEITNFVQNTENIGTSGQPTKEQFKNIAELGYCSVINLAMPDSDNAIPEEGSIVTSLGMNYFHIPVPFDSPTVEHLRQFIGIMESVDSDKTWVHCAVNARVSAFMFHYLSKVKGYSEGASKSPVIMRWEPKMDDVWKSFMKLTKDDIGL